MTQKTSLEVPEVPIQEPEPTQGRIAWWFENTFVRGLKQAFNAMRNPVKSILAKGLSEFLEDLEMPALGTINPVFEGLLDIPGLDPKVKETIQNIQKGDNQSDTIYMYLMGLVGFMGLLSGPASIMAKQTSYESDMHWRTARPQPDALWAMKRRGILNDELFELYMKQTGWPEALIQSWGTITKAVLPAGDVGSAYLRGELNVDEFKGELRKRGFDELDLELIEKLLQQIPGPQDLIRMAVREAWHDDVARTFGYDEDFPVEFGEWTEKIGLSTDWAKRYWRAHWELPGVREGFEMLHRRIIDESELELLLRSRDIPSFWRKNLIQLSYRPYTRVDVRRMYKAGVLSEQDVYDNYRDLGSDDEHAEKLTEWTIKEYTEDSRDLAKGDVLSAYEAGTITSADAITYLDLLGYGEDELMVLLARVDLKKEAAFEKEIVENVRVGFVGGYFDENDVFAKLGSINPPAGFIEERLKLWRLQRERAVKRPTLTQLAKFWIKEIIDESTLKSEMKTLGYNETYVGWFMELWSKTEEE